MGLQFLIESHLEQALHNKADHLFRVCRFEISVTNTFQTEEGAVKELHHLGLELSLYM